MMSKADKCPYCYARWVPFEPNPNCRLCIREQRRRLVQRDKPEKAPSVSVSDHSVPKKKVRQLYAKCPHCGGNNSLPLDVAPPGPYKCGHCGGTFTATLGTGKRTITEMRCTCLACGRVWFYGKSALLEQTGADLSNLGKSMACCSGCLPAAFLPDAKSVDLTKCPNCGSKAVRTEKVIHEV